MTNAKKPTFRLTHTALFCRDVKNMVEFYAKALGMVVTDEGLHSNGIYFTFMSGDPTEHHQLVLVPGRPEEGDFQVAQQFSFIVDDLDDLRSAKEQAEAAGAEPNSRTHGNAWSIYYKDPEDNTIEIYTHTPWYVPQPHSFAFDLSLPNDEVVRLTEEHCRKDPKFMSSSERERVMAEMIEDR